MTDDEKKIAHRGGQLIKVLRLAHMPGMDEVAIKLNCGLTWDEQQVSEKWFMAFKIAGESDENRKLFEQAAQLAELTER